MDHRAEILPAISTFYWTSGSVVFLLNDFIYMEQRILFTQLVVAALALQKGISYLKLDEAKQTQTLPISLQFVVVVYARLIMPP